MRLASPVVAAVASLLLASVALAQGAPPATPPAKAQQGKKKKEARPEGPVATLLGFEAIAGGGSRIYVELSESVTVTQHEAQGQVVFVLENVQIKTGNTENALELYYHDTPVLRAKLRRAKPDKKDKKAKKGANDAELLLEMKTEARPTHKLVEGRKGTYRLEIDFAAGGNAPGADERPPAKKKLKRPRLVPSSGAMQSIRTRADLALLLERHMAQSSARSGQPPQDEEIEGRTALKTYLLSAHGRMRSDPRAALGEVAGALGLQVRASGERELLELALGETVLWLDSTTARFPRLYSVSPAKDSDRVAAALVAATGLVEPIWLPPRMLESLARTTSTTMVLFSLRHDRRPLRRAPDKDGIDSVTLRFWGPRARDTLDKLRRSEVLPAATSVYSVRLRGGDEPCYCLAEVFHNGKITAIGNSFQEHERMVRAILDHHGASAEQLEQSRSTRRLFIPISWTIDDLGYAVVKMFGGAEPFRLWGLPELLPPDAFRVRAVDLDVGRPATFTLSQKGVSVELGPQTPASVLVRFLSNLQYHVNADLDADVLLLEPLLQLALPNDEAAAPFTERSPLHDVARAVLPEAIGQAVRGQLVLGTASIAEGALGDKPSEPLIDLVRRVMSEAAAHEWRTRIYPVQSPEGRLAWRFLDALPVDASARLRELVRLNRMANQLLARLSGLPMAHWLQLSLFGPETLVPPVSDEGDLSA
jgi:hypothetical protein